MNPLAQTYWDTYWGNNEKPASVTAWQFGDSPNYLAQLVIDGIKTATCSCHTFYELENEPLPTTNDYSIILNSQDKPVAIIKTIEVTVTPMNEVSEEFAIAEGEGDCTYNYWKDTHVRFFTKELNEFGFTFSEDMLLVCERFELIDVKNTAEL
ncbi:ASCH domain-containing protein [Bacillus toyonensis]|uniref:ASCH domain-containing protein n=1 Tax=Bacillus toyonensis TaxID=155322 RepID=UPI000BEE3F80|nr:ASCH domain-containing protein [Bacillus toyonensis]PEC37697.1 RNA-binding protein [Bacillus toyonensis]PED58394.1 RNA-binding protein [Bacillus toyonensis]PEI66990.1 RNA-binding protein [Bacillus toyonensis]PEJ88815.1 RNA-binding protein [Bacillus toyonensis]PEL03054.1 RNA-binding protein [Bacillus toyonensis]